VVAHHVVDLGTPSSLQLESSHVVVYVAHEYTVVPRASRAMHASQESALHACVRPCELVHHFTAGSVPAVQGAAAYA
jgi:hypothetical protein